MNKNQVISFFDAAAHNWDSIQIRDEDIISFILDKGGITKGKKVLDIACGTGVLFPDYIKRGVQVTGVDISSEMLRIAKANYPEVEVIVADAEEYAFSGEYDAVMIYNAFPHFPNPERLISNLWGAMKDGARLTIAHGISEKELEKCHSTVAKDVSLPLPKKEKLADMMRPYFDVDVLISDERMYMVSGVKK